MNLEPYTVPECDADLWECGLNCTTERAWVPPPQGNKALADYADKVVALELAPRPPGLFSAHDLAAKFGLSLVRIENSLYRSRGTFASMRPTRNLRHFSRDKWELL